jgi:hypothetical protein
MNQMTFALARETVAVTGLASAAIVPEGALERCR